jgi:tRNA (cmo5U34)-methyltransferase
MNSPRDIPSSNAIRAPDLPENGSAGSDVELGACPTKTTFEIPRDWSFKRSDVAAAFESHVREQLPWYDLVSGAIAHIVRAYLPKRGSVYDIGASTGNLARIISPTLEARQAAYIGIEQSEEMVERFKDTDRARMFIEDVMTMKFEYPPDVAVLNLIMMFLPVNGREKLIDRLVAAINPGGVIIVVDKVVPRGGYLGAVLNSLALAGKVSAGASAADVIAKELSLSGVQRPLSEGELPKSFVEWFRFGHFAGWVHEG